MGVIPVVLFEVTTLIAASVRGFDVDENVQIEHEYYSESKGLVNWIQKNKIRGITTVTIEKQASKNLEKAMYDELEEKREEIRKDKEKFRIYSILFDSIQRKYRENVSLMDRLHVDERLTQQIMDKEVNQLYFELSNKEEVPPEPVLSHSAKFKHLAKEITKSQDIQHSRKIKKLMKKSIIPDPTNKLILSEAVNLKRTRFKDSEMYLVSLDNHFSGFKPPYEEIPNEIKKKFDIQCLIPQKLLQILRS